jgi:DinB family protein
MAHETLTTRSGATRAQEMIAANAEFVAFIATCTDDEWSRVCAAEGWPVGVVAHHIAWGHEVSAGWIRTIRSGKDVPGSSETHNAGNEAKAAEMAGVSRDEVIRLANRNLNELTTLLRSLTGEDLSKSAAFGPGGGMNMSVDNLAGARGHLDRHLGSIRAAVGR